MICMIELNNNLLNLGQIFLIHIINLVKENPLKLITIQNKNINPK